MKLKYLGYSIQKIHMWAYYSRIAHHSFLHSLLRHFTQAYARYFNEMGRITGPISANTHHLIAGLGLSKLHISLQQIMALGAHLYISGYYWLALRIRTVLIIFLRYPSIRLCLVIHPSPLLSKGFMQEWSQKLGCCTVYIIALHSAISGKDSEVYCIKQLNRTQLLTLVSLMKTGKEEL